MTADAASVSSRDSVRSSDFFQPHRAAFWLYLALLVALGVLTLKLLLSLAVRAGPLPSLVAFGLFAIWVGIFIWVIRRLDVFKRAPASLMAAAFVWGALVAASALAVHSNNNLNTALTRADPELSQVWGSALSAPTTEEVLKALGVVMVALIATRRFHRLMDGVIYGALAGLGFQFTEDILYALRDANPHDVGMTLITVLNTFVQRAIISGAFSLATYTAMVGFGIAYYLVKRQAGRFRRLLVLIGLFLAAWLFHFLNNALVGFPQFALASLLSWVLALALALWLYDRARGEEYLWFRSVLADDIGTDLISAKEAHALAGLGRRRRVVTLIVTTGLAVIGLLLMGLLMLAPLLGVVILLGLGGVALVVLVLLQRRASRPVAELQKAQID